jgi:hypothetical protein
MVAADGGRSGFQYLGPMRTLWDVHESRNYDWSSYFVQLMILLYNDALPTRRAFCFMPALEAAPRV